MSLLDAYQVRRGDAAEAGRPEMFRAIMAWIADRFADSPGIDDSIAWEDGEAHEDAPRALVDLARRD